MSCVEESEAHSPAGRCNLCGCLSELFELPGEPGNYCSACSGDVATAILVTTEIDAATFCGRDAKSLAAEFNKVSEAMLRRSQLHETVEPQRWTE